MNCEPLALSHVKIEKEKRGSKVGMPHINKWYTPNVLLKLDDLHRGPTQHTLEACYFYLLKLQMSHQKTSEHFKLSKKTCIFGNLSMRWNTMLLKVQSQQPFLDSLVYFLRTLEVNPVPRLELFYRYRGSELLHETFAHGGSAYAVLQRCGQK